MCDAIVQKACSQRVIEMYKNVRNLVQRCDIARFVILYQYGGIYADLDVLPNRRRFWQVQLGFAMMESRVHSQQPELEMEFIVAERGHPMLMRIVEHMVGETEDKARKGFFDKAVSRFIYQTTGPCALRRCLKAAGFLDKVHVYAMNRPRDGVHVMALLASVARSQRHVKSNPHKQFDVLSSMSMSYRGAGENINAPLGPADTELPGLQPTKLRRVTYKRRPPTEVLPFNQEDAPAPVKDRPRRMRSQIGSQPTASGSDRIAEPVAATDTHGSSMAGDTPDQQVVGRQLVEFFRADHNRRCIGVSTTMTLLPPECQSYIERLIADDRQRLM